MTLTEIMFNDAIHIKECCDITKDLMKINARDGARAMLYVTGTCVNAYLRSWSETTNINKPILSSEKNKSDRDALNGVDKIKNLYAQCVAEYYLRYDYRGC